ncbi:response regulator transcription factor [Alicyclobacillus curvatus]|nr:response regulator transcription factor [Alicyclobacillus curvatus]
MPENGIRIVIADDQALIRQGLRYILESQADMHVVGEAEDGHAAVQVVLDLRPDIVLMDIQMPGQSGIHATRELMNRLPKTKVVLLTTFDVTDYVFEGIRAGAVGYLLKDADSTELLTQVRLAHQGAAVYRTQTAAEAVARAVRAGSDDEVAGRDVPHSNSESMSESLTDRETEVLQLMAYGRKNREIARALVLTEGTVKTHVHRILQKLEVDDRTQAVVIAIRTGMVK